MAALQNKPMKAFIYQDHDAHIATHMSFMQDPMIAQMIVQNPQAKQIMASLQAHVAEHLGFKYRKDIEERLGVELPKPNEQLPEEIEVNLSRLVATASKQLTQAHMQQAAQKEAQQKAQDPIIQMQQAELQIKAKEVERKAKKDQADAMLKAEKLKLDEQEVQIAAEKSNVQLEIDKRDKDNKMDMEIFKTINQNNKGK